MVSRQKQFSFKIMRDLTLIPKKVSNFDVILNWDSSQRLILNKLRRNYRFLRKAPIENIDVLDPNSEEYGALASFSWRRLRELRFHDKIRQDSVAKLLEICNSLRDRSSFSLVLGTGPSFEKYKDFDLTGGVVIACNSAVEDSEFFRETNPDFLCFVDGAHHIGPSRKAEHCGPDYLKTLTSGW
jgi:hypothetical protein